MNAFRIDSVWIPLLASGVGLLTGELKRSRYIYQSRLADHSHSGALLTARTDRFGGPLVEHAAQARSAIQTELGRLGQEVFSYERVSVNRRLPDLRLEEAELAFRVCIG